MKLQGYKIVYKYKGKVRYSNDTYSSIQEAEKVGMKDEFFSMVIPFYL